MNESFLHYIWQYRLFDMTNLRTEDGLIVEVVKPGNLNTGAGPDFFNSQLRIDGTLWAGNVEIHIHSSDWSRHNHQTDPSYESCILHVVYKNDAATLRMNGTTIPSIELKDRYPPYLWDNYLQLIGTHGWIPCQHRIKEIDESTWKITNEKMINERLDQRMKQIFISLKGNKDDWQECFYQHLAKNFGFQLNAMPFEMLARSLPYKIIMKERTQLINLEALLFGAGGMLAENLDSEYPSILWNTYQHLSKKYSLKNIPFSAWKFLRLRPVNFPSVRIAQFAKLIFQSPSIFNDVMEAGTVKDLCSHFNIIASDFWNTHYHFENESSHLVKKLGKTSINNILINTCIPFLYSWGKFSGDQVAVERAFNFLNELPAESNHLIDKWKDIGIPAKSAVDSQALLQLKIVHCSEKKCLTCNVGNRLINMLP